MRTRRNRTARHRFLAVLGSVLLAAAGTLAAPGTAQAANLLSNAGFESGTLSGWSCSGGLGSVVGSPVHSGTKALAGAASASDNAQCTQTISVRPNTTYALTGWVRGHYVHLGVTGGASTWTPSASDWTRLSVSFTTGASQTSAQIYLHGWYAKGTYYADDVGLDGPAGGGDGDGGGDGGGGGGGGGGGDGGGGGATGFTQAAPYLYLGWGDPPSAPSVMSATGIKWFTMAFVLASGGCNPVWDQGRPLTGGTDQSTIDAIRGAGGDVVPSIGGWSGNKLGPNCSTPQALAGAYQKVIDAYRLKALDVDIENSDEFESEVVQDRILSALKIVKQNNPGLRTILTFGTSTTGPTYWGNRLIERSSALGAGIDVFTVMPFDFGGGADMYGSTVNAAEGLKAKLKGVFGWSDATAYAHMGISGMNGLSDQQEQTTPQTWTRIRDWANAHHIARLAFWSVNRDRPCPGGGVVSNCSGIGQSAWQFTSITAGFTG